MSVRLYPRMISVGGIERLCMYPCCSCHGWNGRPGGLCQTCGLAIPDELEMRYNAIMWTINTQVVTKDL